MPDLQHLDCHTGTVTRTGHTVTVQFRENQKLRTCFLGASTQFIGPVDDKRTLGALREGLSVNVWLGKSARTVQYASVNWR